MSVETAFAPFLDAPTMHGLLARRLPALLGAQALLCDLRLLHSWRKTYARPGNAHRAWLSVCYEMDLARSPRAPVERVLLHGRATPLATSASADVAMAGAGAGAGAGVGAGWPLRLSTPSACIELRLFPDDPAMPQLAALYAPQRVLAGDDDPRLLHARVVSYRPGERCTLAIEDASGRPQAFAKTFADGRQAAAVAARLEAVARGLHRQGATTLQVPAVLRLDADGHTLWTAARGGAALAPRHEDPDSMRALAQVATALAELHSIPVAGLPQAERTTRLTEARRKLRKLAGSFPEAVGAAAAGLARCEVLLADPALRAVPATATRHGDLHPGQCLLHQGRVALFDFDELAQGDPEEDLVALAVALAAPAAALAAPSPADSSAPAPAESATSIGAAWLAPLVAAHASSGRAPRAPRADLLELHWRLQWLDRAYRSFWRHGDAAAAVIQRALHAVAAPFDAPPTIAGAAP